MGHNIELHYNNTVRPANRTAENGLPALFTKFILTAHQPSHNIYWT